MADRTNQPPHTPAPGPSRKVLTFELDGECYGISILRVREIIGMAPITPLPRAPVHVRGVMNLRGRIVPVIDLRTRFGLATPTARPAPAPVVNETGCIVILDGEAREAMVGIVVDAVRDVQDIAESSICPPPGLGADSAHRFVGAIGRVREQVVLLLDLGVVLGGDDCVGASQPQGSEKAAEGGEPGGFAARRAA